MQSVRVASGEHARPVRSRRQERTLSFLLRRHPPTMQVAMRLAAQNVARRTFIAPYNPQAEAHDAFVARCGALREKRSKRAAVPQTDSGRSTVTDLRRTAASQRGTATTAGAPSQRATSAAPLDRPPPAKPPKKSLLGRLLGSRAKSKKV